MSKIKKHENGYIEFWCPGCNREHLIDSTWSITGTDDCPTIKPSVLCRWGKDMKHRCHLFVTDGKIKYLDDCTHYLAGKTIDMVPLNV